MDDLIGYTTAIQTATKESGNVIGNSLKSVISRTFSDDSEKALAGIGIALKDVSGEARNVNQVWGDLAVKFKTLSQEQRQQIGLTIAGRYHLTRFLALMDNWSIATQATTTSQQSLFSALEENRKHLQSLESQINKVKTAGQEFSYTLGEQGLTSVMSGALQGVTLLLNGFTEMAKTGVLGTAGLAALVLGITTITFKIAGSIPIITKFGLAIKEATLALATNPYFLAATAIIGVVSAISMYIGKQKQLREEQEKVAKTVQESTKAFDDLRASMDEVGKPTLQNINDTEAQIKKYDQLIAKLSELQNQTDQIYIPDTGELIDVDKQYNPNELSQELKDLASNLGINIFQIKTWAEFLSLAKQKQDELNVSLVAGKKNSSEYQGEQIRNAQAQLDLANNTLGLVQEYKELNEVQNRNEEQSKRLIEVKNMLLAMFPSETANGQIVVGLLEIEAKKRLELAEAYMGQTREQLIANQKSTQAAYETAVKNIALYQAEISTLKELWAARANKQAAGVGDFRMLDNLSDLEYRLDQEKGKANSLAKTISEINNILNWKPKSVGGSSSAGSSKSSGSSSSNNDAERAAQELAQKQKEFLDSVVDAYKEAYEKEKDIAIASLKAQEKAAEDAYNAEIKRLDDELSKYEEVYNAKLKLIDKEQSDEDYASSLSKEQKIAQDIQNQINVRSMDTSIEGRAKKAELEKQLAEQLEKIQEMQTQRSRDLRKQNLEDEYNKYKDSIEAQKDAENQKYESNKAALEKQIADTQFYYDELVANERKYADIRQQIISGNIGKIKEELTKFADDFAKINKDKAKEIGISFEELLNLATKVNSALNNNPYPVKSGSSSSSGGSSSSGSSNNSSSSNRAKVVNVSSGSHLNVRQSPNGAVIGSLSAGEEVQTGQQDGEWVFVSYNTKNGKKSGWANRNYLKAYHQGGIVGNLSVSPIQELVNKMFNTSPSETVVKSLLGELQIPPQNIMKNFVPNMQNLINSISLTKTPAVAGIGDINVNFFVDKIQGTQQEAKNFASMVRNELAKKGIR